MHPTLQALCFSECSAPDAAAQLMEPFVARVLPAIPGNAVIRTSKIAGRGHFGELREVRLQPWARVLRPSTPWGAGNITLLLKSADASQPGYPVVVLSRAPHMADERRARRGSDSSSGGAKCQRDGREQGKARRGPPPT